MGYTTEFKGEFKVEPPLTLHLVRMIEDMREQGRDAAPTPSLAPDIYCQWIATRMGDGLVWDGEEKFCNWQKWLQYLVDLLKENGHTVTGSVRWQGEEHADRGTLSVHAGLVAAAKDDVKTVQCPMCGHVMCPMCGHVMWRPT